MLTNTQKKQLRTIALESKTKYQIGKMGISETVLDLLDKALVAHELISVDVLKSLDKLPVEIALDLSSNLHAEVVNIIGRNIILYRKNKKKEIIHLVK
jgi:RNA-binding protein